MSLTPQSPASVPFVQARAFLISKQLFLEYKMVKRYYIRATGDNRWLGGSTYRWLRIRGFKNNEIKVIIYGSTRYTEIDPEGPRQLEFAEGIWPDVNPCSWETVKRGLTK